MGNQPDFGYPWWLSYGHLLLAALASLVFLTGYGRRWSRILLALVGAVALWAFCAFLVIHFAMDVNGRASLPTESFLQNGTGRVLDMGAGTGRSSIMVLEARPGTVLVAYDLFGTSFDQHFGRESSPQDRLRRNLRAAGVEGRATIETGDMRKMPFPTASFDAIVSSYAIDHLSRDGIRQALSEAARVLKPQGEFLLMIVGKDPWLQFTFGPLLLHSHLRGADWWTGQLREAGLTIAEQGMRPATIYVLARKP